MGWVLYYVKDAQVSSIPSMVGSSDRRKGGLRVCSIPEPTSVIPGFVYNSALGVGVSVASTILGPLSKSLVSLLLLVGLDWFLLLE